MSIDNIINDQTGQGAEELEASLAAYRAAHWTPEQLAAYEAKSQGEASPITTPPYTQAEDARIAYSLEPAPPDWYATRNGPGRDEWDNQ